MKIDVTAALVAGAIVIAILLLAFVPTPKSHPLHIPSIEIEAR